MQTRRGQKQYWLRVSADFYEYKYNYGMLVSKWQQPCYLQVLFPFYYYSSNTKILWKPFSIFLYFFIICFQWLRLFWYISKLFFYLQFWLFEGFWRFYLLTLVDFSTIFYNDNILLSVGLKKKKWRTKKMFQASLQQRKSAVYLRNRRPCSKDLRDAPSFSWLSTLCQKITLLSVKLCYFWCFS